MDTSIETKLFYTEMPTTNVLVDGDSKLPRVNSAIELQHFLTNTKVTVADLYKNGPCLLFCVRSMSCLLCKRMTAYLMEHKPRFDALNLPIYCIAKEVSSKDYVESYWQEKDKIYVDPQYDLFRLVGDGLGEFRRCEFMDVFNTKVNFG
jgi:hypothetical protein